MDSFLNFLLPSIVHMPESRISLVSLSLLAVIVCHLIWTRYHGGLHKVPGPFIASLTSFWKWHIILQEDMALRSWKFHEKYGPLVRIGPDHISASSPEAIRAIYVENRGFPKASLSTKYLLCVLTKCQAPSYGILQPQLDGSIFHTIFSTQDIEYHSMHKRVIGSVYTTSALKDLQANIDRCTALFVSRLEDLTQSQPAVLDMSSWLQYYTFDSLLDVMFSKPIGFLTAGVDIDGICELDHHQMMYYALVCYPSYNSAQC